MNSTRKSLCAEVSARLGIPTEDARKVLEHLLSAFTRHLAQGERVHLKGWGALSTRTRKGRGGVRNLRTMEACPPIPRHRVVRFRPHWRIPC